MPLVLSTIAAGLIAISFMLLFAYLPLLWSGRYYDILAALGSVATRTVDARSRFLGGIVYGLVGLVFAFVYGVVALGLLHTNLPRPSLVLFSTPAVTVDLFFPLLGLIVGLIHGLLVAFWLVIVVIEHHPLERFRQQYILVLSQIIIHGVFGTTVMFFHSQFLQLLSQRPL
ncbi:MAG: hypothetical protein AAF708_17170 [Deinococcota bacterium]